MSTTSEKQDQQEERPPAVSSDADDAEMQKLFARINADGDGRISPSKLAALSRTISPLSSSSHGHREVVVTMDKLDTDRDLLCPELPSPSTELATLCSAPALTKRPLQPQRRL
jgi:Ca2+-binding EF-hand superfamily protein